jgi:hypothetical protein
MADPGSTRTRPPTWLVIAAIAFFLLLLWFAVRLWRSADRGPVVEQAVAVAFPKAAAASG